MSGNSSEGLLRAVRQGDIQVAKELIETVGLSHAKEWLDGYALLCEALQNDDEDMATFLLNSGCRVNISPADKPASTGTGVGMGFARSGSTPLHFVVGHGNEAMAKLLLARGADANAPSRAKKTPLHVAAEMRREKLVKLLLKNGANVDACDKYGKTALSIASDKGDVSTVENILTFCPDVNVEANRNGLYTAVNNLAYTKSRKIIEALLVYGFTVCAKDSKVACILHEAVEQGNVKVVEALLNLGADVDTLHRGTGVTLLHNAVVQRQVSIVELLLSHGANVNVEDENENIPVYYAIKNDDKYITKMLLSSEGGSLRIATKHLHLAVMNDSLEIVEILLYYAPLLNVDGCDEHGRTALYQTAMSPRVAPHVPSKPQRPILTRNYRPARRPSVRTKKFRVKPELINTRADMAKMFLSRGADPNSRADDGTTPLHRAAESGYTEVVQILLENGAIVDATRTGDGMSALHLAAARDNRAVAMLLLANGAPINATDDNGKTPLHLASGSGHEHIVRILAERDAKLNCQDAERWSPLHLATLNDNIAVVGTLVDFGADLEIRDRHGRTALHLAVINSKPDITITLVNHGADVTASCNNGGTPMDYAIEVLGNQSITQLLEENMVANVRRPELSDSRRRRQMAVQRLQELDDVEKDLTLMREIVDYLPELLQMLPRDRALQIEAPAEEEEQPEQEEPAEAQQPVEPRQRQKFGNRLFVDVAETASVHEFCQEVFYNHHDDVYVGQILEKHILAQDVLANRISGKPPKAPEVDYEGQFQEYCLAELESMATRRVGESHLTYHSILTVSWNQLITYARNKDIVTGMEGRIFEAEFPLYGRTMCRRFRQAQRREYLLGRSVGSLISLSGYLLPSVFVIETVKYLDNTDLENLFQAEPDAPGY